MIIWFVGIFGAGKTTIDRKLKAHFNEIGVKNYLLDGDLVRDLFDRDLGYSDAEREASIKLSFWTLICWTATTLQRSSAISPLWSICALWPGGRLPGIDLPAKKDLRISMKDDVKGVYRENINKTQIVGIDAAFDQPRRSDLVLEVDKQTEDETYQAVLNYIMGKYGHQYR